MTRLSVLPLAGDMDLIRLSLFAILFVGWAGGAAELFPVRNQRHQREDGALVLVRGHWHGLDTIDDRTESGLTWDLRGPVSLGAADRASLLRGAAVVDTLTLFRHLISPHP